MPAEGTLAQQAHQLRPYSTEYYECYTTKE